MCATIERLSRARPLRARARPLRAVAVTLAGVVLIGSVLSGCGVVRAVKKAEDAVHNNAAVIDLFTTSLKAGQPASFAVTYITTGSSPSKIVYAVRPPGELAFTDTPASNSGAFELIVNSGGEYLCTRAVTGSSGWACQKLPRAGAPAERTLLDFYTPAHWVNFLKGFSLAAGFAGDKISTSRMSVNGFAVRCVDFVAGGVTGTSKVCTTSEHLLGYVQVASHSTGFEVSSYTASPAAALFTLPPGATVAKSSGS